MPIELAAGGVFVFGPELAPHGMTIDVDADGPVDVALACDDAGDAAADAFAHDRAAPQIRTLARRVVQGHARLHAGAQTCKVAVIARSLVPRKVTLDWRRPAGEQARSTGGPALRCVR